MNLREKRPSFISESHEHFWHHVVLSLVSMSFTPYWILCNVKQYGRAKAEQETFTSSLWFPITCCRRRLPLDCWLLFFVCSLSTVFVFSHSVSDMDRFLRYGQFGAFYLVGVVHAALVILRFHRAWIPTHADYLSFLLIYFFPFVSMMNNLDGGSLSESLFHVFFALILALACASILLEAFNRHVLLFPLVRSFCSLLASTWFLFMGFILHPPVDFLPASWDPDDINNKDLIVFLFVVLCTVDLVLVLLLSCCVRKCDVSKRARRYSTARLQFKEEAHKLLHAS